MNPVLRRELIGTLLSRRTFVMQLALVAGLSLIVLVRWPSDSLVDTTASQSSEVFRLFGYGLLALLLLMIPAFPAISIVKENRQGTLQLLLNSPLKPWSIYAGKFTGVLLLIIWFLMLSGPALAACFLMGGLSLTREIALLYVLLLTMAVQVSSIGLLVSTLSTSTDSALRLTYGVVVATSVLVMIPHLFLQGKEGVLPVAAEYLRCVSPIAALMEILGQGDIGSKGLGSPGEVFARYLGITFASAIVLAGVTISRLNHRMFDRSRSQGKITNDMNLSSRLIRRLIFVVDPQRRSISLGGLINPVLIKEFRIRRFGRMHWILRLVAFCAVVSIGITYVSAQGSQDWGVETVGGIMVILQIALILLLMPAISSGLISSEIESGGWALLQMTPMWIARIVFGKLMSALIPAFLILLGTLPGYLVLMWIEPELEWQVKRVLVSLLLAALTSVLVGAAISSLIRRTAVATAVSYGVLIGLMASTFLVWLGRDAPFGASTVEAVLTLNPVAAALSDMRTPGFETYQLTPMNWWISGTICLAALAIMTVRIYQLSRPR